MGSKMSIDYEGVTSNVYPAIDSAKTNLESAQQIIASINVPSDFSASSRLKSIGASLAEDLCELELLKSSMKRSIEVIMQAETLNKILTENLLFKGLKNIEKEIKNKEKEKEKEKVKYEEYKGKFEMEVTERTADSVFRFLSGDGRYGVEQGMFNSLQETEPKEYTRLKEKLKNEYNMSEEDSIITMKYLDSLGVCTYATYANNLIYQYADKPEEFRKIFGYDLYRITSDGKYAANGGELLLDMFVNINSDKNINSKDDRKLYEYKLKENNETKLKFKSDALEEYKYPRNIAMDGETRRSVKALDHQQYLSNIYIPRVDIIREFIGSKTDSKSKVDGYQVINTYSEKYSENLQQIIEEGSDEEFYEKLEEELNTALQNGYALELTVNAADEESGKNFYYYDEQCGYRLRGGHSTAITKVYSNGVGVASWGEEMFVTYEELKNQTMAFSINATKVENKPTLLETLGVKFE